MTREVENASSSEPSEPVVKCNCPDVYPDWDGQTMDLGGTCVHEMKFPAFFHMPVSYDMYVRKQASNLEQLELREKWPGLVLANTGIWGGKIIRLLEDSDSPSRFVYYLPGSFWVKCQLHRGGIGTVPKAAHQMQLDLVEQGCMPKELYLIHLTCPVCVEHKGGEDKILILRRFTSNKRMQERLVKQAEKKARKAIKKG